MASVGLVLLSILQIPLVSYWTPRCFSSANPHAIHCLYGVEIQKCGVPKPCVNQTFVGKTKEKTSTGLLMYPLKASRQKEHSINWVLDGGGGLAKKPSPFVFLHRP